MAITAGKTTNDRQRLEPRKIWWTVAEFGKAIGVSTDVARARLTTVGAAVMRGGRWYTTRTHLRRAYPDEWPEIVAALTVADDG